MPAHHDHIANYDCGDGVPALHSDATTYGGGVATLADQKMAADHPRITVVHFAVAGGVATQVLIGAAVALGGNPFVGAVAALTVLACCLTLILATAVRTD